MKHYILIKFKPGAFTPAVAEESRAMLSRLVGAVDGFDGINVYENCMDRSENYDLMIEMELRSEAAFAAYRDHPFHREFIAYASPKMVSRIVFDRK